MRTNDLLPDIAPSLLVIIVNYRTGSLTLDCLHSLFSGNNLPYGGRVIVADADSNDGSDEMIRAAIASEGWFNRAYLLPLQVNKGFSFANNRALEWGIKHLGRPRYVLYLNPDTIVRPGALQPLLDFLNQHSRAGIVGAQLEDPDGTPQACAFRFPSMLGELESEARIGPISRALSRSVTALPFSIEPIPVEWVSGAALLSRMELLEEIGLFDEDYFLYFEEVDFCRRAARAHWQCWHVPQSHIVHLVGCSTGVTKKASRRRRPSYWFNSRYKYYLKYHGRIYVALCDLAWFAGHLLCRLRRTTERKPQNFPAHLLGDFFAHSMKTWFGRVQN